MAFSAAVCWEVRTTGSDANGGGFLAGATGTDFSQQDAAQIAYTDMVIGATTTQFTSVANSPAASLVGNIINVTGGTGFTVQRVQVISVSAGVATCDKSLGTTASTGGTGNMGGALATIATAAGLYVASNKIFVKATATYTTTATITFSVGASPSNIQPQSRVIGYTTTRGDLGRPTVQLLTNTGLSALKGNANNISFENFILDCNSLGTSIGVEGAAGSTGLKVRNIKVSNFTSYGIRLANSQGCVEDCEVTAGTSAATAGISTNNSPNIFLRNYVHDNQCSGLDIGTDCFAQWNLIVNNSGASSDGVRTVIGSTILNNTIYNNGRHGISGTGTQTGGTGGQVRNNILVNNGGYGMQFASSAGWAADPDWDGNAYYNNTSGARNNADDTSTNKQNNVAPYTNSLDKTLTGSPFTNAGGGDFTLNNTASAGASCRAGGTPGALPGISQLGYIDMGALQHQDSPTIFVQVNNTLISERMSVTSY